MKLAISNIAWTTNEDEEIYSFLKLQEIKFLEIAPTRLIVENPYYNLKEAENISIELKEKYNLDIVSMQSIWFGHTENIFESEKSFNILLEYTKKAIDFAESIECKNIVFGCPKNRNMKNKEKDYKLAIKFFKEIGNYALNKSVVIAVEPNPTIYNTNFLNTTSEAIEFVKEIDLKSVKINYDLGTVITNNEDLKILEKHLDLINHVHISEPNLEVIESKETITELISLLKQNNYNKTISIEMKKTDVETIKNTISYIKELIGGF